MKPQAPLSTIVGLLTLGAATVLTPLTSFDARAHNHDEHGQHKDKDEHGQHKDKDEHGHHEGEHGHEGAVEGTVTQITGSCPNLRFTVADTQVVAGEQTKYQGGACSDLAPGGRVKVKGTMNEDGTLSASKLELANE